MNRQSPAIVLSDNDVRIGLEESAEAVFDPSDFRARVYFPGSARPFSGWGRHLVPQSALELTHGHPVGHDFPCQAGDLGGVFHAQEHLGVSECDLPFLE